MRTWSIPTVFFMATVWAGASLAGHYDATNGAMGRGSYVGSDHWFASLTQSALIQATARPSEVRGGTGALEELAREDAEKGWFRIPAEPPSHDHEAHGDALWVKPNPDGSWKRPVSDGGWQRPQSDGGWKRPESDGSWKSPQSDESWKSPQSDGDFHTEVSRAEEALHQHDLEQAIEAYSSALEAVTSLDDADALNARYKLGLALLAQQRPAEAVNHLAVVCETDPLNDQARLMYGVALLCSGKPAEAEEQFVRCADEAIQPVAELLLGMSLDAQRKVEAAVEVYEKSLKRLNIPELHRRVEELREQLGALRHTAGFGAGT